MLIDFIFHFFFSSFYLPEFVYHQFGVSGQPHFSHTLWRLCDLCEPSWIQLLYIPNTRPKNKKQSWSDGQIHLIPKAPMQLAFKWKTATNPSYIVHGHMKNKAQQMLWFILTVCLFVYPFVLLFFPFLFFNFLFISHSRSRSLQTLILLFLLLSLPFVVHCTLISIIKLFLVSLLLLNPLMHCAICKCLRQSWWSTILKIQEKSQFHFSFKPKSHKFINARSKCSVSGK